MSSSGLSFTRRLLSFCVAVLWCLLNYGAVCAAPVPVKIGVLAKRGAEQAVKQWQPTADYLSHIIVQHRFVVVPLSFDEVRAAVSDQKVDFLLVNPAIYVEMEHDFHISRIATIKNLRLGKGYTSFGGVVFSRADRKIDKVAQLRGKTFMAVDPTSFGGAITCWRELRTYDFDPFKDFRSVKYGRTHDAVVLAVRDGLVDAGTVRTDTLERMAAEGKIALDEFHIIDLRQQVDDTINFPFVRSTSLYPEWPMAKLGHVSEALATQVAIALLSLATTDPSAVAGRITGWTIPQNYQSVHDCLQILHLGPYRRSAQISLAELFTQYWKAIIATFALLLVTTFLMVYFRMMGKRLKISERDAKEAHAELEQLFQSSADGILRVDQQFNVVRINRTFEKMTGVSATAVIGRKCYEAFPCTACGTNQCPLVRIAAGEHQVVDEGVKFTKDGEQVSCLIFAVPFFEHDGAVIGVVEYYRDVSALKQAEAALQRSRDELSKAYQELQLNQSQMLQQEKMASIGQLAAGVAHEINNPLGFIGSNLGTLKKYWQKTRDFIAFQDGLLSDYSLSVDSAGLAEKRKQLKIDLVIDDANYLIEESLEGVERVKVIVGNLKSFSRLDQANYDLTDINQCLDTTLSIVWNELKYNVTVHKDYGVLPLTYCYPQQLNQVFLNLLVNAGHAIEEKGEIHISTRREENDILVEIRDNGCGVPEENLSHLFEPFFTTKEVGKGTGLGLSIVYDIIKKHHGSIDVDSRIGEGTTFIIRIPVVESAPQ